MPFDPVILWTDALIYLLVVVSPEKTVLFQGVTPKEYKKMAEAFKKLAHTIKFK